MVTEVTKGIKVSVESEYQKEYSSPRQYHFVFTYKVTIENQSDNSIQLRRRHWFIKDAGYTDREIEGIGVIGVQPVIEPGQFHSYVSGCNLKSGIGKMYGTYDMVKIIDGSTFQATIPEFIMILPEKLN
jgi:ApaG protein